MASQLVTLFFSVAVASVILFQSNPAAAESVSAGMINASALSSLVCGAYVPIQKPDQPLSCRGAKFQECSSCDSVLIINNSPTTISVKLVIEGQGFDDQPWPFVLGCLNNVKAPTIQSSCRPSLAPGEKCYQSLEFCPERAGISRGMVHIILGDSNNQRTLTYHLLGPAKYSPDQQAAENVRIRHLGELMSIPNVDKVSLGYSGKRIGIDLGVIDPDKIAAVRRLAPMQLEGFAVTVSQSSPSDNAF